MQSDDAKKWRAANMQAVPPYTVAGALLICVGNNEEMRMYYRGCYVHSARTHANDNVCVSLVSFRSEHPLQFSTTQARTPHMAEGKNTPAIIFAWRWFI